MADVGYPSERVEKLVGVGAVFTEETAQGTG